MLDGKKLGERAREIFETGVCCSEAVVCAIAEALDPENTMAYVKMSSGLCGGMGVASVCGVVTGGSCAIAIALGRTSLTEEPAVKCSTITKNFFNVFEAEFTQTGCRELKACVPEGKPVRQFCAVLVERGTELAAEVVNKNLIQPDN